MQHRFIRILTQITQSLMLLSLTSSATNAIEVRYPTNINNPTYQQRDIYFNQLLKLALEYSGEDYQLVSMPMPTIPEERSMKLIQEDYYNIHWMGTTANREKLLLPIYIPLDKGLLGWRLMLVHQDNKDTFANITSTQQIKKLTAGLGHHWPDTRVFYENKFKVFTATTTTGLQKMLNLKRIDYFPRSILEIWQEHGTIDYPALTIDPNIVITYPAAIYFFVAKGNLALHDCIKKGLEVALANGSFDKLFQQNFADVILLANLNQRRRFNITNSLITDPDYLKRKELWFSPSTAHDALPSVD
ncbi:amino acid ABC transporter substrate-binding protein [Alteromonadaceae bacterium BrNp21-10]|nr:amino acid ABC transporter substrate-binding protein [Alteromonadaceae bacterium BrNp21-10]